jgi:hypothetical protein
MRTSVALLLVPLILLWGGLLAFALIDLLRPQRRVAGGNKLIWALVIVLIGTIGPLVYLLAGRREAEE